MFWKDLKGIVSSKITFGQDFLRRYLNGHCRQLVFMHPLKFEN